MGEMPRVLSVRASSDSAGCVQRGDVLDVSTNTVSTESHMISHMIGQVLESGQRPLLHVPPSNVATPSLPMKQVKSQMKEKKKKSRSKKLVKYVTNMKKICQ